MIGGYQLVILPSETEENLMRACGYQAPNGKMRSSSATLDYCHSPSHPQFRSHQTSPYSSFPLKLSQTAPKRLFVLFSPSTKTATGCSASDPDPFPDEDEEVDGGGVVSSVSEDGVAVEVEKTGRNSRRIRARVAIAAGLDAVWDILTDYDGLSDVVPGLAVSRLIEKRDNFARIYQVGQQNLPLGLKFSAKAVLDCYEGKLEILANSRKRDIEFKMIEGDFQVYEGKWSIEQFNDPRSEESVDQAFVSTLSYFVDVRPKPWLPFQLIEGRLCKEIKTNLLCVRSSAEADSEYLNCV